GCFSAYPNRCTIFQDPFPIPANLPAAVWRQCESAVRRRLAVPHRHSAVCCQPSILLFLHTESLSPLLISKLPLPKHRLHPPEIGILLSIFCCFDPAFSRRPYSR